MGKVKIVTRHTEPKDYNTVAGSKLEEEETGIRRSICGCKKDDVKKEGVEADQDGAARFS